MEANLRNLLETTRAELARGMVPTEADVIAQEIRLNGGTVRLSVKRAKEFPGWEIFKARATDPNIGGMNEGTALSLWRPTAQILRMGTHLAGAGDHQDALREYEAAARAEAS